MIFDFHKSPTSRIHQVGVIKRLHRPSVEFTLFVVLIGDPVNRCRYQILFTCIPSLLSHSAFLNRFRDLHQEVLGLSSCLPSRKTYA